jgi:adenosylcobinamide kinase/adenosylcobinamide-phosphate guanylyltransferase
MVDAIRTAPADVIIVSNEVGAGVVPAYPSGRLFRDVVGRANQQLAQAADRAYVVIAGMPVDLRALRATDLPWGGGEC